MKCPVCAEKGMRSTVNVGMSTTTCMGFSPGHYDEDGQWVEGVNPNITTTRYRCSHGHRFVTGARMGKVIDGPTITQREEDCPHWRIPDQCDTCRAASSRTLQEDDK